MIATQLITKYDDPVRLANYYLTSTNVYCNKYIVKNDEEWTHVNHKVSRKLIAESLINNNTNIGLFAGSHTKFFAIDIDFHDCKYPAYDRDGSPTLMLVKRIKDVTSRLFCEPSFINWSPRGAHLYYLLNDFYPTLPLIQNVKRLVKGTGAEVKPTMTTALRLPKVFQLTKASLESVDLATAKRYHLAEVIGMDFEDTTLYDVDFKTGRSTSGLATYNYANIGVVLNNLKNTIKDGDSNYVFCQTHARLALAQLDCEEIGDKMHAAILETNYKGDLRRKRNVVRRIKSLNKTFDCNLTVAQHASKKKDLRVEKHEQLASDIIVNAKEAGIMRFSNRDQKTLQKFITNILCHQDEMREIYRNPGVRAAHNAKYRMFSFHAANGFIPIWTEKWISWNARYKRFQDFLKDIGFLKLSTLHYSTAHKYCSHFMVVDTLELLDFEAKSNFELNPCKISKKQFKIKRENELTA